MDEASPGESRTDHLDAIRVGIVGSMGVGKSTVGSLVAARLGIPLEDSDVWIERELGESGRTFAEREGVGALHRLEKTMLARTVSSPGPFVVTPAASVVEDQTSRNLLGTLMLVVWLDLDPETGHRRATGGDHRRRIGRAGYRDLHTRRVRLFEQVADLRLPADRNPEELAGLVVSSIAGRA